MENAHKQPEDNANPDLVNTPVSFAPILDEWSVTAEADTDAFVYTGRVYGEYGMRPGHRRRFTVRASARGHEAIALIMSETGTPYRLRTPAEASQHAASKLQRKEA